MIYQIFDIFSSVVTPTTVRDPKAWLIHEVKEGEEKLLVLFSRSVLITESSLEIGEDGKKQLCLQPMWVAQIDRDKNLWISISCKKSEEFTVCSRRFGQQPAFM